MAKENKINQNLQPQALDAEEAVLGSMLSSKEAVSISIQWLKPECFYKESHSIIFTAMESLFGSKIKISKERGVWKELIIHNKTYLTMITFHPAYLLRQADQKKYSWADLKLIRKKIDELKISV